MSKEIIRKEIDQIMETIAEQWEIIRAYEGKIPLIEMDIFMNNIRKLYEDLYLIDKLNKTPGLDTNRIKAQITREPSVLFDTGAKTKTVDRETKNEAEIIAEAEKEPLPVTETMPAQEQFKNEPHTVIEEPIHSEPKEEFPIIKETEPTRPPEPVFRPQPASTPDLFGSHTTTLADKFQDGKKAVIDQLVKQETDNSLGNRMQQSQITDLKSAIGINEKFLFINELFKGDLAGYNRAVESLNLCHSRQEALSKLDEMRQQYNWSELSGSYLRLGDFLRRRFAD